MANKCFVLTQKSYRLTKEVLFIKAKMSLGKSSSSAGCTSSSKHPQLHKKTTMKLIPVIFAILCGAYVQAGIIGNTIEGGKNITDKILDGVAGAVNKIEDKIGGLLGGLFGSSKDTATETKEEVAALRERLEASQSDLFRAGESGQGIFDSARDFLNKVEEKIAGLLEKIENKLEGAIKETGNFVLNQFSDLQEWSKKTIEAVAGTEKEEEAKKKVNDFVESSMTTIEKCVNFSLRPIQSVYEEAKNTSTEALDLARNVIEIVETCTHFAGSPLQYISNCVKGVPSAIAKTTSLIVNRVVPLQIKVSELAPLESLGAGCFAATAAGIAAGKLLNERLVKNLSKN